MKHSLADLAARLGGRLAASEAIVTGFATDSNSVKPGDLFLAIRGARVDGHDFAPAAMAAGAVAVIAERPIAEPHILVENLPEALARMAASFRAEFTGPVIGITGSAGKTTTKELVAAALARLGPVLKTSGNRNTEYTAPLLWAELTSEHRVAVVEMAMRGFGQIAHLAAFSRPTLGLVTNIGHSHLELVGSREGIAKAKSELLEALGDGGLALLPRDDDFYGFLCQRSPRVRTFGYSDGCDCQILSYRQFGWSKSGIGGLLDEEAWSVVLPTIGRHLGLNAAAAILAAHECGVPLAEAATDMESAQLPPMRMEIRERDGVTILLDAYNAAPASMAAAIQVLSEEPVAGRRRAVIGEMRELGPYSESAHRDLALWLMDAGIEDVILIGEATRHTLEQASDKGFHRAANLDDIRAFLADSREGDVVLIKGSRAFELEKALE